MTEFDKTYWSNRYQNNETGWDIGHVSTPLKEYFDQLKDKTISILIPGAGNAYEAEYLHANGFKNVYLLDITEEPLKAFLQRVPGFDPSHCIQEDFFTHSKQYDLIIEQTFFCALSPDLRKAYVTKMYELLKPAGKLAGLLFNIPLNTDKPPFGGNEQEYRSLFTKHFHFKTLSTAVNSIGPRQNNELFFIAEKNPVSALNQ